VYDRRVQGEVLNFGHRGWLYEEAFLFYDYKTDSLWLQATGECIYGTYKGTKLERIPATHTTWSRWRELHPETRVLGRTLEERGKFARDVFEHYYESGRGVKYQWPGPLYFGMAVLLPGEQKYYPFPELTKTPVVMDQVDAVRMVVVFHAASNTAVAFRSTHNALVFDFEPLEVQQADILIRDRQTGSTWSGLLGLCRSGPRKGTRLVQVTTSQFVYQTWTLHYSRSSIYRAPRTTPSAAPAKK
jgi:hypothetical protein